MKKLFFALIVMGMIGGGVWLYMTPHTKAPVSIGEEKTPYVVPPVTKEYKNTTYRFSLRMPENFTASEMQTDSGSIITLQDEKGQGIQITLSPYDKKITAITATDLALENPDLQILAPEKIELGDIGSGLAFKSDNAAFGGDSREAWFALGGTLYQISTYARYDALLKAMFATWEFN